MEDQGQCEEVLKAVNEESALVLLHAQCQHKILVNVKGIVKCVSEVIRIKQVQLFMVQLLPRLNIFVKKKEYLKWHKDICPQKCYIFTQLKPTRLKKGCTSQHQVFTVTNRSKLVPADEMDESDVLDTEEWLQQCGIEKEDVHFQQENSQSETDSKLVSYQGVVTKELDEALGVYELDNRVRLYVSTVPALHKYQFIQVGLSITLYNVHCQVSKEAPRIRLYCCMLSCIKTGEETTGCATKTQLPQAQLQKMLYVCGMSTPQLDWLHTTRDTLFQYYSVICGRRDVEKICSVLLSSPRLSWEQESADSRNLLDEFLSPIHACCLSTENEKNTAPLPKYRTVSQLKHDIETGDTFITRPGEYWQFERKEFCNGQILIGVLGSGSKTGYPRLYDSTDYINAVIAGSHDDKHSFGCQGNCCCDRRQVGDKFLCPFLHTCCIGKIVAIYKYSVVMETFLKEAAHPRDFSGSSASSEKHKILYIEFSMSDAVILRSVTKNKKSTYEHDVEMTESKLGLSDVESVKISRNIRDKFSSVDGIKDVGETNNKQIVIVSDDSHSDSENTDRDVKERLGSTDSALKRRKSILHRHLDEQNGTYFCRKESCLNQNEKEKCVPLLSVKPVFKKRKSIFSDKTDCKVLCDSQRTLVKKIEPVADFKETSAANLGCVSCDKNKSYQDNMMKDVKPNVIEKETENPASSLQTKSYCELKTAHRSLVRVNSREALIFESCTKDSVTLMFNVQGQIWKNGQFESELVIVFNSKAVKWYPFLQPNCLYHFSVVEQFSPLFKRGLANSKLERAVERSKAKKCVLVNPEVNIDRIFDDTTTSAQDIFQVTISEVLGEGETMSSKFVSLKGLIVSRNHCDPEPLKSRTQRNNPQYPSMMDWSRLQISTPENRCIRLQVRDVDSAAEITVFMNLANTVYLLGLVPGTTVLFTKLERKVSRVGNIYCRFTAVSSVYLIDLPCSISNLNKPKTEGDVEMETKNDKVFPKLKLIELWQSRTNVKEFQCVCDVLQITKVSLKCVCDLCGCTVKQSDCPSIGCHMENGTKFVARVSFIIDDGSSVAIVTQTGIEVKKLLGLSHDQWVCLEEETREHGEVFVQQTRPTYGSALEKFVYMLCDNRQVKKSWVMTLKTKQYNNFNSRSGMDLDALSLDDFALKSIDTGSKTINTRCLPFLQFECLQLQEVDPTLWALYYLTNNSHREK